MKKILCFLLIFLSLKSFAQYPNGIQAIGNDSNVVDIKGALRARVINKVFTDTATANLSHMDEYPGAQIFTISDNQFWLRNSSATQWIPAGGAGISIINIITDSSISICNFNSCDTFITNVTAQLVTILDDSTLLVCDTLNVCDTLHIPRTQFAQTLFDTTTIYQNIQNVYNYFSDTSFTNQFFPRGDGVLLDTVIRITDSTLRFIYTDGTQKEDTFRIALTQENITNITNIINYIDSLRGNDTTFILSASNLQSGLKALYSTTDSLSGNDTLHLEFPHNNIAEDSVLTTDVDGDLKMKLVTSGGGGAIGNVGTGYRGITDNGTNEKTFFPGLGMAIDSTSNVNGLTFKLDTSYGKKYFTYGLLVPNDSTVKLDKTVAVTYDTTIAPYQILMNYTAAPAFPTWTTNPFADSLRRSADSIYRRVNGVWIFQYKDSIGAGATNYWTLTGNDIYNNNGSNLGFVGVRTGGTPGSIFQVRQDTVNTFSTNYTASPADSIKSISLINNTPATVTQNQYSPMIRFRGSGWKTNATAGSQKVEWRMYGHAITGAANPTSSFILENSINAGNYGQQMTVSQAGLLTMLGGGTFGGNVSGVAGTFTGRVTSSGNNGTTAGGGTSGFLANPVSGATSGVPQQFSPEFRWISNAWDGSQNYFNEYMMQARGINGVSPTTSALWWSSRTTTTASGAVTDILSLNNFGKFTFLATNTAAGTTGNQTINKASGTVNIAAGGTTVTVTNNLVSTSSLVFAEIRTNDATAQIKSVVPGAGSFVINIVASTGEVSIGFFVIN